MDSVVPVKTKLRINGITADKFWIVIINNNRLLNSIRFLRQTDRKINYCRKYKLPNKLFSKGIVIDDEHLDKFFYSDRSVYYYNDKYFVNQDYYNAFIGSDASKLLNEW